MCDFSKFEWLLLYVDGARFIENFKFKPFWSEILTLEQFYY